MGQGENRMKVSNRKKLTHAGIKPARLGHGLAFRAMPVPAGVVDRPLKTAPVTAVYMPAQVFGATADNGG